MKRVGLYNYENYLNTISLLRERVVANRYLQKSQESYRSNYNKPIKYKNQDLKINHTEINSNPKLTSSDISFNANLPVIKTSNISVSTTNKSKKGINSFNFNYKYDEWKMKRLNSQLMKHLKE